MNLAVSISIVGILALAAYFLVNSTSNNSTCTGIDTINPLCWISSTIDNAENEVNTIVIVILLAVVALVALILFAPNTVGILGSFRL